MAPHMDGPPRPAPVYFRPMATRRTPPSSPKTSAPRLRTTELPGVYLNADGAQVDERGVLLSLSQVRSIEADLDAEVLGEPVTSPALLLKRVALDARLPLTMRLSAAKDAAPYFDRKMPLALEGGSNERPLRVEQDQSRLLRGLAALSPDERKAALALLEKLGAMG